MISAAKELLKQLFKKPATNMFPSKHAPDNITDFLEKVKQGKAKINKPIDTPNGFRGRLIYDEKKCIKCRQCLKVCPAAALEFDEKNNRINHFLERCTFCSFCVDICPVKALKHSNEFLLADTKKDTGFIEASPEEKPKKD